MCDVLASEWSRRIVRVSFNEAASNHPASGTDKRPANEVYSNKVTELWFTVREWVMADQIRGMDPDTIKEFCSRHFEDVGVESKRVMKERIRSSPDLADAAAILMDVAKRLGTKGGLIGSGEDEWAKFVKRSDTINQESNLYSQPV